MKIKGKQINLRKLRKADASSFSLNAKDKEISLFTKVPHPYLLQNALDFIKLTHQEMRKKTAIKLGIEHKGSKTIVGVISLTDLDYSNKKAELSYWLGKRYWGKKIMKEAIVLILNFVFNQLNFNKVYATVMHPNTKSARLLEACGFQYEGTMRQNVFKNGEWLDQFLYSILKDEFQLPDNN